MNKKILSLLIFIISFNGYGQYEWAPIGATWYYSFETGYTKMESVQDVVIQGINYRQLKREQVYSEYGIYGPTNKIDTFSLGNLYTYLSNDTVYIYDIHGNGQPVFLYDFGAKKGDIWKIPGNISSCDSFGYVVVDSVYSIE